MNTHRNPFYRAAAVLIICVFPVVSAAYGVSTADAVSAADAQQNDTFPSIEPAFVYRAQTADGELTPQDLIQAALAFSECPADSDEGRAVIAAFSRISAAVSQPDFMQLPEPERAEAVLSLLYRDVLKRYRENESRIQRLFAEGTYNCVSSSILYMAAARAAGLTVTGQKTPDHAFCTLNLETGAVDVETTNPYGFDPGSKKALAAESANASAYAYVPKRKYANRAAVSDRVFVGLIGGNLSVSAMNRGEYGRAVPLAAARYVFLAGETGGAANDVRKEFDIVCTNYLTVLQKRKAYDQALRWAAAVTERWGTTDIWQKAINTAVYNTVVELLNGKSIPQAESRFTEWEPRVDANTQRKIRNAIVAARDAEGAAVWIQKVIEAANGKAFLEAAEIARQGLAEYEGNAQLKKLHDQCLQNYASLVHNQIALLYNRQSYEQAKMAAEEGLSHVPASKLLQNDLLKITRQLENNGMND
ncbi:hypothetical protein [Treponema brennaborense]|uniref:Transglutaminase domain-containing protein n=1 Tax=Treponema brennaborense (strain DSM 12168 / CIP 105900 / DD5/3) TaxID=906968 RepID=F4LJS6_TREBD|nr:hypothetical protein [Treponema brennaborense]AEE17456.1 hypothetical protein Trebr_2041 [Treponema brennaborense DSM 12168]